MKTTFKVLACLVLACLALAGCSQPDGAPAGAASGPAATADAPPVPEFLPSGDGQEATGGFDVRGFAGRFEGTLPCAGCPRVDSILQLRPDGGYVLTETYPDAMEKSGSSEGTWSVEAGGQSVRLDPNRKDQDDRLYEIASRDELRQVDTAEGIIPTKVSYSLQRAD
ncbi:MAG: copper resistance protein NlpE [Pseudomonadota bacterium]|nr:copper resistance protein NlpE [Pseudomonadota bacterium]